MVKKTVTEEIAGKIKCQTVETNTRGRKVQRVQQRKKCSGRSIT